MRTFSCILGTILCACISNNEGPSTATLPTSKLYKLKFQQSSRKTRYAFSENTQWMGWVYLPMTPIAISIADFSAIPSSEEWLQCLQKDLLLENHLWISSTPETVQESEQYARMLQRQYPVAIQHVSCL